MESPAYGDRPDVIPIVAAEPPRSTAAASRPSLSSSASPATPSSPRAPSVPWPLVAPSTATSLKSYCGLPLSRTQESGFKAAIIHTSIGCPSASAPFRSKFATQLRRRRVGGPCPPGRPPYSQGCQAGQLLSLWSMCNNTMPRLDNIVGPSCRRSPQQSSRRSSACLYLSAAIFKPSPPSCTLGLLPSSRCVPVYKILSSRSHPSCNFPRANPRMVFKVSVRKRPSSSIRTYTPHPWSSCWYVRRRADCCYCFCRPSCITCVLLVASNEYTLFYYYVVFNVRKYKE